jgi:molybdopterin synthase sulfur carrier subunit
MPRVFIPPALRSLAGGAETIDVEGRNVREAIDHLESRFPGMKERLCRGDELQPGLAVAIDGAVAALGLWQRVGADSEVHFLPAVGGG